MPHIKSDPDTFVDEALEGFARAHAETVKRVDGGVVRRAPLPAGHAAVVIGGGSGHYPAFAGTVGEGLAAGAVCGQIFTSPSAGAAYRVGKAAEAGGGVLFSYGNYAGDVIHFGEAERRLNAEGIDCRTVLVTDDVASAPLAERSKRRGIAGDFVVFKIAGALAAEGASLDEVERVAIKANEQTVTMGVAFDGCTLPGAEAPLFTVPDGMMSVGLGIHGEPGVRDEPTPNVTELAQTLIEPLLAERPDTHDGRVGVVVNGLGTVKYEELFVLLRHVWDQLSDAGLEIVVSECGELVTSLDMAGASLTLTWLDDELQRLWLAPAYTPAYRRGHVPIAAVHEPTLIDPGAELEDRSRDGATGVADEAPAEQITAEQQSVNERIVALLAAARDAVDAVHVELGDMDAIAGDGDHGTGMMRGLDAALAHARQHAADATPTRLLVGAGDAWSELAGGTSGALWGAALAALGPHAEPPEWDSAAAAADALAAIRTLGKAEVGDKTMVDAIVPYVDALSEHADGGAVAALRAAAVVAQAAASDTAALSPKLGRARPLAERSIGHPDPGATSFAIIASAVAEAAGEAS